MYRLVSVLPALSCVATVNVDVPADVLPGVVADVVVDGELVPTELIADTL